jgi:hypothetical protein
MIVLIRFLLQKYRNDFAALADVFWEVNLVHPLEISR